MLGEAQGLMPPAGAAPAPGADQQVAPDGSVSMDTPSTDPMALIQQLLAMGQSDQQKLQMQQMLEAQMLAEEQRQALVAALTVMVQALGQGAHMPAGADAATASNDAYAGMAPQLPADVLAQHDQQSAQLAPGVMSPRGEPVFQPDAIPPEYG